MITLRLSYLAGVAGVLPQALPSAAVAEVQQVIRPTTRWKGIDWRELWQYRELLYFLSWRDIKVRYKQTALGAAWAVIQPLASTLAFSLIFGRLAGLDQKTGGIPYVLYVYTGLLPWLLFANSVTGSGQSMIANANLVTKVYFPRLIVPLAAIGTVLVDFTVSLVVFVLLMAWYGITPSATILLMPVFLIGTVVAAAGLGTLLSALSVSFRDFQYVIPFGMQFALYVTPVVFPVEIVPEPWRLLLYVNPMTGFISGFRTAFLAVPIDGIGLTISTVSAIASLIVGVGYFHAVERRFADII